MTIISPNIKPYLLSPDSTIKDAIFNLHSAKNGLVFVCDSNKRLLGVLSQGDINEFIIKNQGALENSVEKAFNVNYKFVREDYNLEELNNLLQDYRVIPIVGVARKLIKIAYREDSYKDYSICNFSLNKESQTIVIAEIGNNHNGNINLAKEMISQAAISGADIIKLQMRDITSLYGNDNVLETKSAKDLGSEYLLELLSDNQLNCSDLFELFDYIKVLGKEPLCTPWDKESLKKLYEYGLRTVKFASADFTNHELLGSAVDMGMNLICSTGMSTQQEVIETSQFLKEKGALFYFLHCQSSYPAAIKDINLSYMDTLKKYSRGGFVGYSSHDLGINVCLAAVSRGAKIIEKHFTTDKSLKGVDHRVSLLPREFTNMVNSIREIETSIGRSDKRMLSQGELINRATLSKSIFTKRDLRIGEVISVDDLIIRSPGNGLQPNQLKNMIGKKVSKNLSKDNLIFWSDLEVKQYQKDSSLFSEKCEKRRDHWNALPGLWGIPVRPHDIRTLFDEFSPKMLEFHLSYKDLNQSPSKFCHDVELPYCVVHAPELFHNEHLLDLCSFDNKKRKKSINEMKRVIEFSKELLAQIPRQNTIGIVTNVGGHSDNSFLSKDDKGSLTLLLEESLRELRDDNVELWPQTMPPFPWHFGGQRFHNLFVDPYECIELAKKLDLKLCLDISHTKLACNFMNIDLLRVLPDLIQYSDHFHIADADNQNGEGLQIDKGEINFIEVFKILGQSYMYSKSKSIKNFSWIPEIWRGHENQGFGFKVALNQLSEYNS